MKKYWLLILFSFILVGCQNKIELVDNPMIIESVYYQEEDKYYDALYYNSKVYQLYGKATNTKDLGSCIGYLKNIYNTSDQSKYICLVNNYDNLLFLYDSQEESINVYLDIVSNNKNVPNYVEVIK